MSSSLTPIRALPRAHGRSAEIFARLGGAEIAVFLDYDGTLTPIVDDPAAATIDDETRGVLAELASSCPVAIVSGRDLADVRQMVGVKGITYAGSHGFDIVTADGARTERGAQALPALDAAEDQLAAKLRTTGARLERKRFALAVHYRGVDPARLGDIEAAVHAVVDAMSGLRITGGKMIFEVRPDIAWDKGRALLSLLDAMGGEGVVPLYVGDDVTDEDALRVVHGRGLGLVVAGEDDDRLTIADYALDGPPDAIAFLRDLAQSLRR